MTAPPSGSRLPARQVRWERTVDPARLVALAAIVIDTVSPVDDPTGHPTDPANVGAPADNKR